ncbi:MAG: hypothetical protein KJ950_02075 [Proteobacteria bacterium]|nr:hypothetical protein [Pseudomonadota bacterium]MBU1687818.1 hypothetical protein [Pseudomonadota bacterium]
MKHRNPSLVGNSLGKWVLLGFLFLVSGCAVSPLTKARQHYFQGNLQQAVDTLGPAADTSGRNELLYYMEKGVFLHGLGEYQASTDTLLKASRLMAELETISLSRQTAAVVSSDLITKYPGEYCERLWVHTLLMMNYLLLSREDEALVEAKQALKVFDLYPEALKKDYFSRALIALCYENLGEDNDAFIEYRKLMRILPTPRLIARDLYRLGSRLGRLDELKDIADLLPQKPTTDPASELVIFLNAGRIPVKFAGNIFIPPHTRISFPQYHDSAPPSAILRFDDPAQQRMATQLTTDLGEVAHNSLKDRATGIIAKEATRVAAKEALIQTIRKNGNELAVVAVQVLAILSEEADTRSWQALPGSFSLVRVPLAPGSHQVRFTLSGDRQYPPQQITILPFTLLPGQRKYQSYAMQGNMAALVRTTK